MRGPLYSELLAALRDTEPPYMPEIRNKLVTKARARALGMGVPELYAVFARPRDLDLLELPNTFALKRHSQPSSVLLLRDGKDQKGRLWTTESLRLRMVRIQRRLTMDGERQRLFAEEYVIPPHGCSPNEHRFFVIDNKARFILIDFERFEGRKQLVYTPDWKKTPYWSREECSRHDHPGFPKPDRLGDMIAFAEEFSRTWPSPSMVVDLFIKDDEPLFGEAGIFHLACHPVHPEWDEIMGKMWVESCGTP